MSHEHAAPPLHDGEVPVDDSLARDLLATQLPALSTLQVRRVPSTGTDCAIFRLGDELGLRLPRIGWAAQQIAREVAVLPTLGPHLSIELPQPVATGTPSPRYPFPWLVFRWVDGDDMLHSTGADAVVLARDLASFVHALGRIDPMDAPLGGRHGGDLASDDTSTRACIDQLRHLVDAPRAIEVWDAALDAGPWQGAPRWVHGDLLPGNVIVRDGHVAGVIDWSAAGVGDPACELMLAWSLPEDARAVFCEALPFDAATWARARGLVVEQAVHFIAYYATTIPDAVASATRRLAAVLGDGSN
jgi:aminoglycoside phosphotransferase (APT) family kinase protein